MPWPCACVLFQKSSVSDHKTSCPWSNKLFSLIEQTLVPDHTNSFPWSNKLLSLITKCCPWSHKILSLITKTKVPDHTTLVPDHTNCPCHLLSIFLHKHTVRNMLNKCNKKFKNKMSVLSLYLAWNRLKHQLKEYILNFSKGFYYK